MPKRPCALTHSVFSNKTHRGVTPFDALSSLSGTCAPSRLSSLGAMANFKPKRSWTRFSRSSFSTNPSPETIAAVYPPGEQTIVEPPKQTQPPPNVESPHNVDAAFLQNLRKLLFDFEQVHKLNSAPLSDQRVLHIRKEIEKSMPRLYALQSEVIANSASGASRITILAENCLKMFPDVNDELLRSYHRNQPQRNQPQPDSRRSPKSHTASPPRSEPATLPMQHHPTPRYPAQYANRGSLPVISGVPSMLRNSAVSIPIQQAYGSHSQTSYHRSYNPVTPSPPPTHPTVSSAALLANMPVRQLYPHFQDQIAQVTPAQKSVFSSLQGRRINFTTAQCAAWYEPPSALSPDEINKASDSKPVYFPSPYAYSSGHAQYTATLGMQQSVASQPSKNYGDSAFLSGDRTRTTTNSLRQHK